MSSSSDEDNELASAVRAALARKGVLNALKSKLRAEVFHVLENKGEPMPDKTREVFLASELIRDFLVGLKLDNTLSVFMEEMGQPQEARIDRSFIASEIGMSTSNEEIPLLVMLVELLQSSKEQRLIRQFESTDVTFDQSDI
jgi:hypothetical protein